MAQITDMQFAAAQFGAANRVIADDTGIGSYYVAIPQMTNAQLFAGGDNVVHPAFRVNGVAKSEILIAKYHAFVKNNRAYSLPGVTPSSSMDFDTAVTYCKNKGAGHHLITNAEYALLALWAKMNNSMPRGNTNYGASSDMPSEVGIPATKEANGPTKTGASYPAWYHNGDLSGIDGLCGNLWHWCAGLRLKNGEIQIIPDNDAAMLTADFSDASPQWKGILQNGNIAAIGTANTLKINGSAGDATQTNHRTGNPILDTKRDKPAYSGGDVTDYYGYLDCTFETFAAASGVTAPVLLKALGIFPADASGYQGDWFHVRNYGERFPLRGGNWGYGAGAGVFDLNFSNPRSGDYTRIGFRSAFYE